MNLSLLSMTSKHCHQSFLKLLHSSPIFGRKGITRDISAWKWALLLCCVMEHFHRGIHNFIQGNGMLHLVACHRNFQQWGRKWTRRITSSVNTTACVTKTDFNLAVFNNEDHNSHDPTLPTSFVLTEWQEWHDLHDTHCLRKSGKLWIRTDINSGQTVYLQSHVMQKRFPIRWHCDLSGCKMVIECLSASEWLW